jgi:hypothetical protein
MDSSVQRGWRDDFVAILSPRDTYGRSEPQIRSNLDVTRHQVTVTPKIRLLSGHSGPWVQKLPCRGREGAPRSSHRGSYVDAQPRGVT